MLGTEGADVIASWSDGGVLDAMGGNDTVSGSTNTDTISGGKGNDSITDSGGIGNLLRGDEGNDTVWFSRYGTSTVEGGSGDDLIYADVNNDPASVNVLSGGIGNDRLSSGRSSDTYLFNRGDGQDTISDFDYNGAGKLDKLQFGPGIAQSQLKFYRVGTDLLITVADSATPPSADQITIENWFSGSVYQIESFVFADGSSFTKDQLPALVTAVLGTGNNEAVSGTGGGDMVLGLAGNDTVTDASGSDTIEGGSGNDLITDNGGGSNILLGESGNDTVNFSGSAYNTIEGGAGDDLIQMSDVATSSSAMSNVLVGGQGNDRLVSGSGADTYKFGRGDGVDTILDTDAAGAGRTDTLEFGPGIAAWHLVASRQGDNLRIRVVDPSNFAQVDQVTIESWFTGSSHRIERFLFADGSAMNVAQIEKLLQGQDRTNGGLGLENMAPSSASQPGAGSSLIGQERELALFNSGNGNFVLQDQDTGLASTGLDIGLTRTYNSQAGLGVDGWSNWQFGLNKSVRLDASGKLVRANGDGSEGLYTLDGTIYRSTDGQGAYDAISFDAGAEQWTWTDGASGVKETYDAAKNGRIVSARDRSGNVTTYGYTTAGLLDQVTDASGEKTVLVYDTSNVLKSVRIDYTSGGVAKSGTRVYYEYDGMRRLTMVKTDLTPDDNSIGDGNVYWTAYSYVGDSGRLSGIYQKDGSALKLTYQQDATTGAWWIDTATDGLGRVTKLTRGAEGTTIEDAAGRQVRYAYDAGLLKSVTEVGSAQTGTIEYDAQGNVKKVTDARNVVTEFEYDANGNQTAQKIDGALTVARTFGQPGQVLTETVYSTPAVGAQAGAQPLTTRHAYDAQGRLRFQLTPEGRVTEWRYNAKGEQQTMIEYAGAGYDVSGLAATAAPSEAELATWAAAADQGRTVRTVYTYDARGLLATATTYNTVAANGAGVADGTESLLRYTYDQNGLLRQSIDARGRQVSHTYDGLGRLETTVDAALQQTTVTAYDDASRRTVTTGINGITVTEAFDRAGQLLSSTRASTAASGTTSYAYDKAGRLAMVRDAAGASSFMLYDTAGRKVADIDPDGSLTEYFYNAANQITRVKRYATNVTAALAGADGLPNGSTLAQVRPTASAAGDRSAWNVYDTAGRLIESLDAEGYLTTTAYDGASRVLSVTRHAQVTDLAALAARADANAPAAFNYAFATGDSRVRYFYDSDGNNVGELDAEGYLTEHFHDAAGQLTRSVTYKTPTATAQRAAGTLAQLRPDTTPTDAVARVLYNAKGQPVGAIDAAGVLTETVYDPNGNVARKVRYATVVTYTAEATLATLRPNTSTADRIWTYTYTALNQLQTETAPDGTVARYTYDKLGNVLSATRAEGTAASTTLLQRYDVEGRLVAELPAAAAAEVAKKTGDQPAIEAVWRDYAVTYKYDAAGRRVSMTEPGGARTLYYYDTDGRLAHTVNAVGEVRSVLYNAFNQVERNVAYSATVASTTLALMKGGSAADISTTLTGLATSAVATRTLYDHNGRVAATIDPEGALTAFLYDASGNVKESFAYASAINANSSEADILAGIANNTFVDKAHDQHQRFVYDQRGQLKATFTALQVKDNVQQWSVSTRAYDANGNLVGATTYAMPLTKAAPVEADLATMAASASDERTRHAYDALNRLSVTATAQRATSGGKYAWTLQLVEYDADGNVAAQRTLAKQLEAADPTAAELEAGVAAANRSDADSVVRHAYDEMGRVTHSATAQVAVNGVLQWSVSKFSYDKAGRLTARTDYATSLTAAGLPAAPTAADYAQWIKGATADAARDRTTRHVYDAGGRLHYTIDALGGVSGREYDARGNLTQVTAYATPSVVADPIPATYAPVSNTRDSVTRTVYDAANRAQYLIDAEGGVSERRYDARGNLVASVSYATAIVAGGLTPSSTPATVKDLVTPKIDATRDRATRYVLDNDGRVRFVVDAQGYLTETQYNALGQAVKTFAYEDALTLAESAQTLAALAAEANTQFTDRKVRYEVREYDAQGRVIKTTDARGASETFGYDGAGNKTSFVNKLGKQWDYAYNAAGQLVEELTPEVAVMDNQGAAATARLVTAIDYDALGNVQSRTEGGVRKADGSAVEGLADSTRTTKYEYDLLGRQIKTILPSVAVYNAAETPSTAAGAARAERTPLEVSIAVSYDALGNALSSTTSATYQADGAPEDAVTTRKVYDKLGQVAYDIDAMGQVTGYQRDTLGNVTVLTRYAQVPGWAGSSYSQADVEARLLTLEHGADRAIATVYNRLGQAVKVTEPAAHVYDQLTGVTGTAPGYATLAKVTRTDYNAYGEAYRQRVYGAETSNPQNLPEEQLIRTAVAETRHYYDQRGERVAQFVLANTAAGAGAGGDTGGYVSETQYSAFGEISRVTDYAGLVAASAMRDSAYDAVSVNGADRRTDYYYDKAGNKEKEMRHGVDVDVFRGATVASGAAVLETRYAYDAVGNLLSSTDPLGGVTSSYYDAVGRVTAVTVRAGFDAGTAADLQGGAQAAPLMLTAFMRDVHGNVVRQTAYATSATVDATGYQAPAGDAADRVTWTRYDRNGNAVAVKDANGNESFSSYDIFGRVAKQWREVSIADTNGVLFKRTTYSITRYDKLGQVAEVLTPGNGTSMALADVSGKIVQSASIVNHLQAGSDSSYVGENRVTLAYPELGNQPIRVELSYRTYPGYIHDDEAENGKRPVAARITSQTFELAAGGASATLVWQDDGVVSGGIQDFNSVRILVRNAAGEWVQQYQRLGYELTAAPRVEDNVAGEVGTTRQANSYNSFGELTGKSVNGVQYEYADYDQAGQVWRTNAGDGVDKVMFHNIAGQTTLQLRSARSVDGGVYDLKAGYQSAQQVAAFAAGDDRATGLVRNETRYDLMGRAIGQTGATHEVRAPADSGVTGAAVGGALAGSGTQWVWHHDEQGAAHGGTWTGANQLDVGLTLPVGLGSGDIKIEVDYDTDGAPANWEANEPELGASSTTHPRILRMDQLQAVDAAAGRYSVRVEWNGPNVDTLRELRVYKKDVGGAWRLLSRSQGGAGQPVGGPYLAVPLPADGLAKVVLEHTAAGGAPVQLAGVNFGDAVLFDLSGLAAGTAQYRVLFQGQYESAPTAGESGSLQVGVDGAGRRTASRTVASGHAMDAQTARASSRQRLDRWGNVVEVTDPRNPNWRIRYSYNDNDQLTSTQRVDLALPQAAPQTLATSYYDALGREVGTRDALGHLQRKVYGADGRLADERHADGGLVHSVYNLFGERTALHTYTDSTRYIATGYGYDHLGQLTSVSTASVTSHVALAPDEGGGMQLSEGVAGALTESYRYDELGRRNRTIDGAGGTSHVRYDFGGNVAANIDELGRVTRYSHDALGHRTGQQNADGLSMRWEVDLHGRVHSHVDLGEATVRYRYTGLGQLATQSSDARGQIAAQNLAYRYDGDQLVRIDDLANDQSSTYAYDLAGNRLREKTLARGLVVQDNHIAYDALNRMTRVADGRYDIGIGYDANGNRTRVDTFHIDASGNTTAISARNSYDEMNRQLIVDGKLGDGQPEDGEVVLGERGHQLAYDLAGKRVSDSYYYTAADGQRRWTRETYDYDAAGRLGTTWRGDARDGADATVIDRRYYDGAGRIVRSGVAQTEFSGETVLVQGSSDAVMKGYKLPSEYRINYYDAAGQLIRQKARALNGFLLDDIYYRPIGDRSPTENAQTGYSDAGNLQGYYLVPPGNGPQTMYKMRYVMFDGYKEALVTADRQDNRSAITETVYDGNGHVIGVNERVAANGNTPESQRSRGYVNDASGQVLLKVDGAVRTTSLVVNGVLLGSSGNSADDTDSSFASTYQATGSGAMSAAPSAYAVQGAHETPSSIAQAVWGDSKLWYLIADANGMGGDTALSAGTLLRLPARVNTVHNDYQSFKPYNAAEAIGNTTPVLPAPAGPEGCGAAAQIIVVVVAVVVTVVSYGALSEAAGAALTAAFGSSTASAAVIGAAAGALGSIASQGVGMAIGAQDQFSWRGVALSALGSGVSYGMAAGVGSGGGFMGLEGRAALAARAAVSNALSQGIGVMTGLQERFDWRGMAASAVGSAAGATAAKALGEAGYGILAQRIGASFAGGVGTALARGGKIDIVRIATDAFGNALGDSIAEMSLGSSSEQARIAELDAEIGKGELFVSSANWRNPVISWNLDGKSMYDTDLYYRQDRDAMMSLENSEPAAHQVAIGDMDDDGNVNLGDGRWKTPGGKIAYITVIAGLEFNHAQAKNLSEAINLDYQFGSVSGGIGGLSLNELITVDIKAIQNNVARQQVAKMLAQQNPRPNTVPISDIDFVDSKALDKNQIGEIINSHNPKLIDMGIDQFVYDTSKKYSLNPKVLLATLAQEQNWGLNGKVSKIAGIDGGGGGNPIDLPIGKSIDKSAETYRKHFDVAADAGGMMKIKINFDPRGNEQRAVFGSGLSEWQAKNPMAVHNLRQGFEYTTRTASEYAKLKYTPFTYFAPQNSRPYDSWVKLYKGFK
ncbi:calcium-binding protein [Pseudoduganella namucuonensis]|nr:calcium-binding protein [Pseudoduganella namucuonensis]